MGGIKGGGSEYDNVVMQQQVGADILSKSKEQSGASESCNEIADKSEWPDQQRDEVTLNKCNSISVGHSAGRDDSTEDTKHPPSAVQCDSEKITSTDTNHDSVYFSERDR